MTDETRDFTDTLSSEPSGHYHLHYTYDLSGLATVTDAFGAEVKYAHDDVGQITGITGDGTANASTYASDMTFRAWGAVKSLSYGDGNSMTASFNARLQPTEFEIPGIIHKSYDYGADGRLEFSHDLMTTNSKFDRSFTYDSVGRITAARTGAEARDSSVSTLDRPYKEDMAYDVFGNLTTHSGKHWWVGIPDGTTTQTYSNDRNSAWTYDADGRLTNSVQVQYTYDAAGRITQTASDRSSITLAYDGDGKRVKSVNAMTDTGTPPVTTTATTYYLPSTVLGRTITDLGENGEKKQGYVYAGGSIFAVEKPVTTSDKVLWRMTDPAGYSVRMTDTSGAVQSDLSAELDSFGTDAGLSAPAPGGRAPNIPGEGMNGSLNSMGFGDAFASGMTECTSNGIEVPCQQALAAMSDGSGHIDPNKLGAGAGDIVNIPGIGDIIILTDPTVPTWDWQGPTDPNSESPDDDNPYDGVDDWSEYFVQLGGDPGSGQTGPGGAGTAGAGASHQPKAKCDAKLPDDENQLAAIYKLDTEHTSFGNIGLRQMNNSGARTGAPITWGTLAIEALLIVGAIANAGALTHQSWHDQVTVGNYGAAYISNGHGGTVFSSSTDRLEAGNVGVDAARNSDIDSDDCNYLKLSIAAAATTADGNNTWGSLGGPSGFTNWGGRATGHSAGGRFIMGDSYFYYEFPGYGPPSQRH